MKTRILNKISVITGTIKISLAMVTPILFIGSITVLLNGFPIQAYQDFLNNFLGGALRSIILMLQKATVGILAVYITVALSLSYMKQTKGGDRVSGFGNLMVCLTGFFILTGFYTGEPDLSLLSGQGVFSALLAGIIGSILFQKFEAAFKTRRTVFADGADSVFNSILRIIPSVLCVMIVFAGINYLITVIFNVQSVQDLFMRIMDAIFMRMQRSFASGALFTGLTSIMWWFGIHGNNVLNQVAENMFTAIIPGEIVSKSFMDTFVNMGGTGCLIGLLITMLVFGKRSSTKRLSKMAVLPGIFNIGELFVFGFPVIYNPYMLVPFILAPLLCFTNAFALTAAGFMPVVSSEVVWTTPALLSGYIATGSWQGIVVQIINILISTACYAPFVIMYEKKSLSEFTSEMTELVDIFKKSEEKGTEVFLTECEGNTGRLARLLAVDLEESLSDSSGEAESPLRVECDREYDNGRCIGAKALLQWDHVRHGIVYPPLVFKIAEESGDIYELDSFFIERAILGLSQFEEEMEGDHALTIGVSATAFCDKRFVPFLQQTADRYRLRAGKVRLEITGEIRGLSSEEVSEKKSVVRSLGYEV